MKKAMHRKAKSPRSRIIGFAIAAALVLGAIPAIALATAYDDAKAPIESEEVQNQAAALAAGDEAVVDEAADEAVDEAAVVDEGEEAAIDEEIEEVVQSPVVIAPDNDAASWAAKMKSVVPDDNFAAVIAQAMSEAGGYTDAEGVFHAYTDDDFASDDAIKTALGNFDGEIVANSKGIADIEGIQYLTNIHRVQLRGNLIQSALPLEGANYTNPDFGGIDLAVNPIHVWPQTLVTTVNGQYVFLPLKVTLEGEAAYLYGTQEWVLTQYINYDVLFRLASGGDLTPAWDLQSGKPRIAFEENEAGATLKDPTQSDSKAEVDIDADGWYQIKATAYPMDSVVDGAEQVNKAVYYYGLTNSFYAQLLDNAETILVGGIKFKKVNALGDGLAGAEFQLLDDKGKPAKDADGVEVANATSDKDGYVVWGNLLPGTYQVKEVNAPEGYQPLDGDPIEVVVSTDGIITVADDIEGGYDPAEVTVNDDYGTWDPQWDDYKQQGSNAIFVDLATKDTHVATEDDLYVEDSILIKNGGNEITALGGEITEGADKVEALPGNVTVQAGSQSDPISLNDFEAARDFINGYINESKLTQGTDVFTVSGYAKYTVTEDNYATIEDGELENPVVPIQLTPKVLKAYPNADLTPGKFSFKLEGKDSTGDVELTASNDADGIATFEDDDHLFFDDEGTYTFTITELVPDEPIEGVIYDPSVYTMTVDVTYDTAGLKAVVSVDGKEIATYHSSTTGEVVVEKVDTKITFVNIYVSYNMEKERVSLAPAKGGADDEFGFLKGNEVIYKVTVENNSSVPLTMDVSDEFDAEEGSDFSDPETILARFHKGDETGDTCGKLNSALGSDTVNITIESGAIAEIFYKATVLDSEEYLAPESADDKADTQDGYGNTAKTKNVIATYGDTVFTEDDTPELNPKEDYADTPVQVLEPKYEMEKVRVDDAPVKPKTDPAKYGFFAGDDVDYAVTVKNTGDVDLTMDVGDRFNEGSFTTPQVTGATFYDAEGKEDSDAGSLNSGEGTAKANITIKAGCSAVVIFNATVNENDEYLASTTADDKKVADDGYLNTAVTDQVVGTYTYYDPNEEKDVTLTLTEQNYPQLGPLDDTANTPVQILNPDYKMSKVRVELAPEKAIAAMYGFFVGNVVNYEVTIENTGNVDLTMNLTDKFNEGKFSTPIVTDAVFYNEEGKEDKDAGKLNSGEGEQNAVVTILAGCKGVITYTATVEDNPEYLAPTSLDDKSDAKDGYLNTATTFDVVGSYVYTPSHSTEPRELRFDKTTNPDELCDRDDTANTPVQVIKPEYVMSKVRVTDAPAKEGTDMFGFFKGDEVTYDVTIENTGEIALTMDVADQFDEGNFSKPKVINVDFAGAGGTLNSALGKNSVNVTIEVDGTAVVTYAAKVKRNDERLDITAPDSGLGYQNTATTSGVMGTLTYLDPNTEEEITLEFNADNCPALADQDDIANTPVQIPDEAAPVPITGDTMTWVTIAAILAALGISFVVLRRRGLLDQLKPNRG